MILYKTTGGPVIQHEGQFYAASETDWDELFNRDDLATVLRGMIENGSPLAEPFSLDAVLVAPIGTQEVWAAGVTYYRSRTARMEESQQAGGSNFYDRVYHADRPELFLKATPHRVRAHGQPLHLRSDSKWIVPEPELTLAITQNGKIVGYTIGNDLSCRDIEGENPLYLPQAKTFNACAGLGPGIYVSDEPLPGETRIRLEIRRNGECAFADETAISQIKKPLPSLAEYLYRDNSFPSGAFLMTGTGIVPPDAFTLAPDDEVAITIDHIGTLVNTMRA